MDIVAVTTVDDGLEFVVVVVVAVTEPVVGKGDELPDGLEPAAIGGDVAGELDGVVIVGEADVGAAEDDASLVIVN